MKILTHIIVKPWKEIIRGRWTILFKANDEKIYTIREAAKIIEIDPKTLRNRLFVYKWDTKGILKKNFNSKKIKAEKKKSSLDHIPEGDLCEDNLGGKARNENLYKIPEPTEFEKKLFRK